MEADVCVVDVACDVMPDGRTEQHAGLTSFGPCWLTLAVQWPFDSACLVCEPIANYKCCRTTDNRWAEFVHEGMKHIDAIRCLVTNARTFPRVKWDCLVHRSNFDRIPFLLPPTHFPSSRNRITQVRCVTVQRINCWTTVATWKKSETCQKADCLKKKPLGRERQPVYHLEALGERKPPSQPLICSVWDPLACVLLDCCQTCDETLPLPIYCSGKIPSKIPGSRSRLPPESNWLVLGLCPIVP